MTNAELIATIQAKIEKLIERYGSVKAKGILQEGYKGGRLIGYEDALNILKRIQEDLEKPMPAKVAGKGLEVEAVSYIFDNGLNISPKVATDFARHFYELGCHRTAEKYDELEYNRQKAEESEKPMNQEGLEEEINRYLREECSDDDELGIHEIAEHFAQWGAEHFRDTTKMISGSSEIPKDLEEASSKFATHTASNGVSVEFLEEKLSFQEGAKWDREQIMKNAKDGWIDEECVIVLNDGTCIDLQPDYEKRPAFEFEYAQNVQVIVLPKEN